MPYRYRRRYYNNNRIKLSKNEQLIFVITLLVFLVYFFIIKPAIEYVQAHKGFFITLGVLIVGGLCFWVYLSIKSRIKNRVQREKFKKEQIENGSVEFIDRFGNVRFGKPEEVKKWTIEDEKAKEKERLINQIVSEIENFKPARRYYNEFPYQVELVGYLKSKFPHADIEVQKGSSRPDIVIGDVAIEVKGPTRTQDLQTISDKCMRYYQHFGELVVVLFETNVYEQRYNEWKKGMENTFPKVKIIRK